MTNRYTQSGAGPPGYDPLPFEVATRRVGVGTVVVEVRGELDLATGPMLHQHLQAFSGPPDRDGRPRRIVYELSGLRFMDACGLTALLTAVDGHGPNTISEREPSAPVRRVLELVGLSSMIEDAACEDVG